MSPDVYYAPRPCTPSPVYQSCPWHSGAGASLHHLCPLSGGAQDSRHGGGEMVLPGPFQHIRLRACSDIPSRSICHSNGKVGCLGQAKVKVQSTLSVLQHICPEPGLEVLLMAPEMLFWNETWSKVLS